MDLVKAENCLRRRARGGETVNQSDVWLLSEEPSTVSFSEDFKLTVGMLSHILKCLSVVSGEMIDANANTGQYQYNNYREVMTENIKH